MYSNSSSGCWEENRPKEVRTETGKELEGRCRHPSERRCWFDWGEKETMRSVWLEIDFEGSAKGLDDGVRTGKRKRVGVTAGPQREARGRRGDSDLGAVEVV